MARRYQFSLRTLLIAITVIAVGLTLFIKWWTAPYVRRHHLSSGTVAREWWRQETLFGPLVYIRTEGYYRSGRKAFEYVGEQKTFWLPDGRETTEKEYWEAYASEHDDCQYGF